MMTRGRKPRPGHITFVGSGPGDPGLLTTRAASVLANAALVFTDPDVPEPVLAVIGKDLPPVSGPAPAGPAATTADGNGQGAGGGCAQAARAQSDNELSDPTPWLATAPSTTCQQRSVETTLSGLTDPAVVGGSDPAGPMTGPLVVTIGKTVASRAKLNWWESRALYGW